MALTRHREGSVKELLTLSFPLMLSSLSVLTMMFADRWFLAQFSTAAHNAAVAATTFGWGFVFSWMCLAGISEVFVAHYNGAGLRQKLGEPVWQMIWLSMAAWLFFIPFSYWGPTLFFGSGVETALERDYFSIMLFFGPFSALYSALCGFFIGQGKAKLITWVVVFANLFNILMDWILIFGIEGWVPSFGVKGAAVATSLATLFQGLILGAIFLNRENRAHYGTSSWKLNVKAMAQCLKIGMPTALFIGAEILAFGCYYLVMREKGLAYITVAGICQSILIVFFFFPEGLNKATTAIVGNMIGAGRSNLILKVLKAGILLNALFMVVVTLLLFYGIPLIVDQFLPLADQAFVEEINDSLQISLLIFGVFMGLEGLRMQLSGILTACGDTMFLLISGTALVWVCMWLPVYLLIGQGTAPVEAGAVICLVYCTLVCLLYAWRVKINQRKSIEALVSID
jgi:multidrug resistance protein, MATE family